MSRVLAGSSKSSATEVSGAPFARARWFNFFPWLQWDSPSMIRIVCFGDCV